MVLILKGIFQMVKNIINKDQPEVSSLKVILNSSNFRPEKIPILNFYINTKKAVKCIKTRSEPEQDF